VDATDWRREVLESNILTVVYFSHEQCPWCIRLNLVFDEVSGEYEDRVKFVKLNVLADPSNRELAVNYGVMSTPTLMFFCDGKPVGQTVGFVSKEQLEKIVNDMLEMYKQCIKQSTDLKSYIV